MLGISATTICTLHCLITPLLISMLPLIGIGFFADESFEFFMISSTLVIAFFAILSGFLKNHKRLYPFYPLGTGIIFYLNKDLLGEEFEPYILVIGAVFVITAHLINYRLCKSCPVCISEVII